MKSLQQILKGVMIVGQLGFTIITPPLVLGYLAYLAQIHLGWGSGVIIAAIVVGIVTSFTSAYRLVKQLLSADPPKRKLKGRSFNEHT